MGVLLYRELGRFEEALADFNALAVENSGYEGEALFNRALLRQQQAHYDEALADLNAFLELPPNVYYPEAQRMRDVLQEMLNE
ncbi:MAG: hypothetical protein M5U34_48970 [Chloroflexi bacterium]|nr:hypothetical protein [Chloroflexota bacterium]